MSSSKLNFKETVCRQLNLTQLSDITNFTQELAPSSKSSLDLYYKDINSLIELSNTIDLSKNKQLGPLILLGICSATEDFFRKLVSDVLSFCPISKKMASEQQIRLGSVLWYRNHRDLNAGIYEHLSFSNVNNISTVSKNYLNFSWKKDNPLAKALIEYDKVCELRHCVAHSSNYIYGKNAIKLDIPSSENVVQINLNTAEIHTCAAICNMLTSTYNSELFKFMIEKFYKEIIHYDQTLISDDKKRKEQFKKLWGIFFSKNDSEENRLRNNANNAWYYFFKDCEKEYITN